jgi:hypothetical protein
MWALQVSRRSKREAWSWPGEASLTTTVRLGADNDGRGAPPGSGKLRGTDAEQVTQFVLESRRLLREHVRARQAQGGGDDRHTVFPVTLPTMAQFRTTRRIVGQATLSGGQYGTHVPTSVGLIADWRKAGHVWEIPYGALIPRTITGLIVAGRCISSASDAWEVTRVIPGAALTGQVAGLAAGLAAQQDITPEALSVQAVQEQLRHKGIPVHITELARDEFTKT